MHQRLHSLNDALYGFRVGGATAVGLIGLARMLPAAFAAPITGLIGDRHERRSPPVYFEARTHGDGASVLVCGADFKSVLSPACNADVMTSSDASTAAPASFFVRPALSATASTNSCLVTRYSS
jgi:hypothetical protein